MKSAAIVFLVTLSMGGSASALYKCVSTTGSTSFQETPCGRSQTQTAIKPLVEARKPGEGAPGPAGEATAAPGRPSLDQQLKEAEASRLRTDATYALRDRLAELDRHRAFCDRQQREILKNRARANNNLAGAMYEQSIATEAAAAATRCETRGRDLQAEVDEARKQCAARGCS